MCLFVARSTRTKHIREIDGLRLLAVATVVASHIAPSVARHYEDVTGVKTYDDVILRLATEGVRGVTLFFVISGFVLSLPFLRASATGNRVSVRRYLVRRLRRIEPPYVVNLAVFLLADIVLLRDSLQSLLPHFLAGLGYAHGLVFNARNPINSVTWSLEVEAQFYLVMPLIASLFFLAAGRRRVLVLSLGALSLMSLAGPLGASLRWTQSLAGCLAAFAIGIVIADLYLNEGWAGRAGSRRRRRVRRRPGILHHAACDLHGPRLRIRPSARLGAPRGWCAQRLIYETRPSPTWRVDRRWDVLLDLPRSSPGDPVAVGADAARHVLGRMGVP